MEKGRGAISRLALCQSKGSSCRRSDPSAGPADRPIYPSRRTHDYPGLFADTAMSSGGTCLSRAPPCVVVDGNGWVVAGSAEHGCPPSGDKATAESCQAMLPASQLLLAASQHAHRARHRGRIASRTPPERRPALLMTLSRQRRKRGMHDRWLPSPTPSALGSMPGRGVKGTGLGALDFPQRAASMQVHDTRSLVTPNLMCTSSNSSSEGFGTVDVGGTARSLTNTSRVRESNVQ